MRNSTNWLYADTQGADEHCYSGYDELLVVRSEPPPQDGRFHSLLTVVSDEGSEGATDVELRFTEIEFALRDLACIQSLERSGSCC